MKELEFTENPTLSYFNSMTENLKIQQKALRLLEAHLSFIAPDDYLSSSCAAEVTRQWLLKQDHQDQARKAIEMTGLD